MKICFIDWFAYALFNSKSKIVFGGAQIQLYLLAQELSKNKKFSVSFLTDNQKNNQQGKFSQIKVYQFIRPLKIGSWGFFIRLLNQLKQINADVYFQRAASAETGLIALTAKMLGKKFIYMVAHEQDVDGSYIRNNGFKGKLFLFGLTLADKIICQTKEQQNQLPERLKVKSTVITSGYPILILSKIRARKQGILWVARAEDWKQPDLLIQLAQNFPKEKFTMICPPADNNPEYFKLVKAKALQISNLKFIDQVPYRKIDAYFTKAKVFISTSLSEGFPNTFIQAAKNMTPIISFKVNPDNIIEKHKIGFCSRGNEKQLIILLKKLLKHEQLRKQLGINAYQYAKRHHDIKKTAESIVANIF